MTIHVPRCFYYEREERRERGRQGENAALSPPPTGHHVGSAVERLSARPGCRAEGGVGTLGIMLACVYKRDDLILMHPPHFENVRKNEDEISQIFLGVKTPTGHRLRRRRRRRGVLMCACVCTGVTLQQWAGLQLSSALNLTYIPRVTRHIALAQPGRAGQSRAEPGPPELPDTGWIRQAENGGALCPP